MKKIFYKIILFFLLIIFISVSTVYCDDIDDEIIDVNAELTSPENLEKTIKEPEINSRAYVVIDRNSNTVLYGKNENTKRKMASTTKIMTAIIIIENCNLKETIEVSKKAANTGGSRLGLKTGDKITIHDLLYGLMMRSGNDAAVALAEYTGGNIEGFASLMNQKASELGLYNTHFETPHGLDSDGHYTTAYELALLSNYALKNETFKKIVSTKNYSITINGFPKELSNTNELLGNLEGVYGIKTGFTNGANRCLVSACKRNDMDIICVVLGADTKKFRTTDSIKLINYVFNNFKVVNIQKIIDDKFNNWKNENSNKFIIYKGIFNNIDLKLENLEHNAIPIRKDLINSLNEKISCNFYYEAPVYKDTAIGKIQIMNNDKIIASSNIYINTNIEKKSTTYYFWYLLKNFSYTLQNNLI